MSNLLLAAKKGTKEHGKITILSGSKYVKVPEAADMIIDVSGIMENDWNFTYTGLEPIIENTLYQLHQQFFINLAELVKIFPVESGLLIVLLCGSGERLSVAAANLLANELRPYRKVEVIHKGLDKWVHPKF